MYSEREVFLNETQESNKANGYCPVQVYGRAQQFQLRIPRDRLDKFYSILLSLMRNQDNQMHDLSIVFIQKD